MDNGQLASSQLLIADSQSLYAVYSIRHQI